MFDSVKCIEFIVFKTLGKFKIPGHNSISIVITTCLHIFRSCLNYFLYYFILYAQR